MSAAVIEVVADTTNTTSTHASAAAGTVEISTSVQDKESNGVVNKGVDGNSSFCRLNLIKKEEINNSAAITDPTGLEQWRHNNVPLENSLQNLRIVGNEGECQKFPATCADLDGNDFEKNYEKHVIADGSDGGVGARCGGIEEDMMDLSSSAQLSPGLSLLQQTAAAASSPPPHSYRHSRAYRHFKNPPQPHMCIRTTTEAGEELFINVLSWTRIVIPQEPSDPIPLYGGMRVPPGSPRSPPLVFAVMANPEVLKDSGRHSKDPEERRAMVELMCDFVEAMNPGVKLVRNAIILKDRDISGELKDVWNAVQAQRDREREEQMILQRQQHFHLNLSNSSATTTSNSLNMNSVIANSNSSLSTTTQQMFPASMPSGSVNSNDMAVITTVVDGATPPRCRKLIAQQVQNEYNTTSNMEDTKCERTRETSSNNSQTVLSVLAERLDNKLSLTTTCAEQQQSHEDQVIQQQQKFNQSILLNDDALVNGNRSKENNLNNQLNNLNSNKELKQQQKQQQRLLKNGLSTNCIETEVIKNANDAKTTESTLKLESNSNITKSNTKPPASPVNLSTSTVTQQAPTKKEKLGGFLPNGCIFPRFTKNNKHKDKDKDKDKEKDIKTKDKEKNVLLSALKKSKDKKSFVSSTIAATAVVAVNNVENNTSLNTNTAVATNKCCSQITQQTSLNKQQQNCLPQLECEIQNINLNKHHHQNSSHNTEKTGTTITINKNNAANKNNSSNNSSSVGAQ